MLTMRIDSPGQERLRGFSYFWLKYVTGFDARQHCARCLLGRYEKAVDVGMPTGRAITLDPGAAPFLYLCGVTGRWADNVHLAMRPAPGRRVTAPLGAGEVTLEGAELLAIPALPEGFRGLDRGFTTCRNYRFGVAYLERPGGGGRTLERPTPQPPSPARAEGVR